jgi:predicted anti-sigma-YlaC factor YlaD
MSCVFTDRISLLLDGELSPADAEKIRVHMTGCRACRQVEQDFLHLRQDIRSYEFETDAIVQRQTLGKVLASQSLPLWRRRIALPAPVIAILVVSWMVLGILFILARTTSPAPDGIRHIGPVPAGAPNTEPGETDLSRFDRGERAMVYKERRSETDAVINKGASRWTRPQR